jgi:hypothetical protein
MISGKGGKRRKKKKVADIVTDCFTGVKWKPCPQLIRTTPPTSAGPPNGPDSIESSI